MATQGKLTISRVIALAKVHHGNRARVAAAVGVTRQAVGKFVRSHPEAQEAFDDELETLVDLAESKLYLALKKGAPWAVCFTLKTQGHKRGWIERRALTNGDGVGPVEIKVVYESKPQGGTMTFTDEVVLSAAEYLKQNDTKD